MAGIRLGLAGCGTMGQVHLRALRHVPALQLAALADADPATLGRVAARHGVNSRYPSVEALLEDPAIEAVAVCLPPQYQARAALAVLRAGKHLFLEKPVALTTTEAQELADQARRSPQTIVVGFHLRHHPHFLAASRRLSQLGALRTLGTVFTTARARAQPGVLLNLGVHHFDLWRFLTGAEVERVYAAGSSRDTVTVVGRLSNGLVATGLLSEVTASHNSLELFGERGRLRVCDYRFDGLEWQPAQTLPGSLGQRLGALSRALRALPELMRRGGVFLQAYQTQWEHFAKCVEGRALPDAGLDDGLRATSIALAAARSLETGSPVRLLA